MHKSESVIVSCTVHISLYTIVYYMVLMVVTMQFTGIGCTNISICVHNYIQCNWPDIYE